MSYMSDRWHEFVMAYDGYISDSWGQARRRERTQVQYADVLAVARTRFRGVDVVAQRDVIRDICSTVSALRLIADLDSPQFKEDLQHLSGLHVEDVRDMLGLSGRDAAQWLEAAALEDFICTGDDYFASRDDCTFCEHYETWYYESDGFCTVRVRRVRGEWVTQEWCADAIEHYAFYCDISREWYDERHFDRGDCEGGRSICTTIAELEGWYWHDGPEEYRDYPEEYEDDEDDENGEDPQIPSYHHGRRNWSRALEIANRSTRGFYGFEIELEFDSFQDRRDFYLEHIASTNNANYCAEHDGSLSDVRGLEIVTRPFALQELRDPNCVLRALLAEAAKVASGDEDGYGVHVNTNWGRFGQDHQARMRDFVFNLARFSQYVAGRGETEHCGYNETYRNNPRNHYSAVHARDDYLPLGRAGEFRIFQSTTDYDRLMSYAEFIDAIGEWTRDPTRPTGGPLAASLFRHWVCLSGQYPSLMARFPQPSHKELHPCVSPSSNRPIEALPKTSSAVASTTTPTAQATPSLHADDLLAITATLRADGSTAWTTFLLPEISIT